MFRGFLQLVMLGAALSAASSHAQSIVSSNSYGDVVWCGGNAYFLEFAPQAADRLLNGRIVRYSPANNTKTVLLERDRRIDLQGCVAGTGEIVFSTYSLRDWSPHEIFSLQPQTRVVEAAGVGWRMLFQTASGVLVARGSIYEELPEAWFDRRKLTLLTTAGVIALRRPGEPAAVLHAFDHHGRTYEYPGYEYFVRPTLDNRGLVVTELALRRLSTVDLVIANAAKPTVDWLPPSNANIIAYDRRNVLRTQLLWQEIVARQHVDPAALTLCEAREQDYVCDRRAFGGQEIETRSLKSIGNGARYVFLQQRQIAGAKVQCVVLAESLFVGGDCISKQKPEAVLELYPSPDGRFIVISRQGSGWRSHDELGHEVHDNPPQQLLLIQVKGY